MDIFVFGSNKLGIHGAGAAKHARFNYGAVLGIGIGRTGNAYAIPTKLVPTGEKRQMKLEDIQVSVNEFITYAEANPTLRFIVTRVGCGLAGYKMEEIAPMFLKAPSNCVFEQDWMEYMSDISFCMQE